MQKNQSKLYHCKKWRDFRTEFLKENICCVNCESVFNLHIDHIFECDDDESLFYIKENLQPLCLSCHSIKTFKDKNQLLNKQNDKTLKINLINNLDVETFNYYVKNFGIDVGLNELKKNVFSNFNETIISWNIEPKYMKLIIDFVIKKEGAFKNYVVEGIETDNFKEAMKLYLKSKYLKEKVEI